MARLDGGRQGVVYIASFEPTAPKASLFVLKVCPFDPSRGSKKQMAEIEYDIQVKLYDTVKSFIPKPMGFFKCKNFVANDEHFVPNKNRNASFDYSMQSVQMSEFCPNGTLLQYLKTMGPRITDTVLRDIIKNVLLGLYKIRQKYPEFRHNDLHLANVLLKERLGVVINDFGWSRLTKGAAETYSKNHESQYGIGPDTDERYDHHMLLADLLVYITSTSLKVPHTLEFLKTVIPEGYRGETDTMTRKRRLRYGMNHSGILTVAKMLEQPYFKSTFPTPSPNRVSPPRPAPTPMVLPPRLATAVRRFTSANLLVFPKKNVMKLAKNDRARFLQLHPAKGKRPVFMTIKKTRVKTPLRQVNQPKSASISPRYLRGEEYRALVNNLRRANNLRRSNGGLMSTPDGQALALRKIKKRIAKQKIVYMPGRKDVVKAAAGVKIRGPKGQMTLVSNLPANYLKMFTSRLKLPNMSNKSKSVIGAAILSHVYPKK
jgi:hypothetical protein